MILLNKLVLIGELNKLVVGGVFELVWCSFLKYFFLKEEFLFFFLGIFTCFVRFGMDVDWWIDFFFDSSSEVRLFIVFSNLVLLFILKEILWFFLFFGIVNFIVYGFIFFRFLKFILV